MAQVMRYEQAVLRKLERERRVRIPFFEASALDPDRPYAILNRVEPGVADVLNVGSSGLPHFHTSDQWQLISEGNAVLGADKVSAYCVHFNRAYTPYSITADRNQPMAYFDFWTHYQPGGLNLFGPDKQQNVRTLKETKVPKLQLKRSVVLPSQRGLKVDQTLLEPVPNVKDDAGLAAFSLAMPPNSKFLAPDPSVGDGQYIAIVTGSLRHDAQEQKAYVMVFVEPKDGPFELHAGAEGLEAIILNFPRAKHRKIVWVCELCNFVYDEAKTMADGRTVVGQRWKDLDENWACPDCGAPKSDFRLVEIDR